MLAKLFSSKTPKLGKRFSRISDQVGALEEKIKKLSDSELSLKTAEFKKALDEGSRLEDIKAEAFAVVREVAWRNLRQRHYDVQLIGGAVLQEGSIAEMRTGEGKTLMSTLAIYLNALEGEGVHVVTVNEYLAKRDTVWMGQIYHALGLKIACLVHQGALLYDPDYKLSEEEIKKLDEERDETGSFEVQEDFLRPISRKEAYDADVTHGTNHEFGFDYLRDNLVTSKEARVQRGQHFAIIDEVDSILIDEARTPLIISAPDTKSSEYYKTFSKIVSRLKKGEDYEVDEKLKGVSILESGIDKVEKTLGIDGLYNDKNLRLTHYLQESLKAYGIFHKDKDYVVKNGEIIIVDQFTGRLMPGRRYSGGVHQAIEAKEGVLVNDESRTLASISIQNYFRLYKKLAGMTGTAQTSAEEFHKVYGLEVVVIPTNKVIVRVDMPDLIYKTMDAKHNAIVEDIRQRTEKGQPVLVGTVSIEKNEELGRVLRNAGIKHEILNAKNNVSEGAIIAQAGRKSAVTVATNMAGRGVDIVLGGVPYTKERADAVREVGGLHVIGTERHESRRIDNQLRGRSGRQGDPGSSQFFLSLDDDLMRIFGGERIRNMMERFKLPENEPIQAKVLTKSLESAQSRVEGNHFDARKHLLSFDDVLNKQRLALYKKRDKFLEQGIHPQIMGTLDLFWMEHLEQMDALRESVRLRAIGQKDPLVEYRREGHQMFEALLEDFEKWYEENAERFKDLEIRSSELGEENAGVVEEKKMQFVHPNAQNMGANEPQQPIKSGEKVGRNDPCPCGSGKKYKKCHGT